ncbi:hypothetical protein IMCC3317_07840 [Kordia antarctica]|uniref:Outer membrane protein beta-barrel domain-containing protein n=1 Tax=Kordia antarctica TaxID=1218801 RepID=A0A7L4ZFE3_9FLAO|nr:outer membrane beta-barrel protein [Kordia antarctica]QHI35438.1 hypothetical protein IMCC3317_07840 [Kordia antarctica]
MKTKPNYIIFILLFILPVCVFSQHTITGKVTDGTNPIPYANVVLLDNANKIISGSISEDDGSFEIKTKAGDYDIVVSFLGYKELKKSISVKENMDLGTIILQSGGNDLDEVVVIGEKKLIERKVDRLVFNVQNSVMGSGTDAMEVLTVVPGIRIQNDQISLIGKDGVRVMINDRLVQLSGEELSTYISTIASDEIEKIEVITNPSAKYQASGNSGLINIVLKKATIDSWKNTIIGRYIQRQVPFYNLQNNFTYKKGKVRMLANINARKENMIFKEDIKSVFNEGRWETFRNIDRNRDLFTGRFELDYSVSKNTTIGVQYYGNFVDANKDNTGDTFIRTTDFALLRADSPSTFNATNNTINAHLISKLDTLGRKISVDLDFLNYNSIQEHNFLTNEFDENGDFVEINFLGMNKTELDAVNYSARVDVEHPIKKLKLSYGVRIGYVENESATKFVDEITGTPVVIADQTDNFQYKERIEAVYASASTSLSKKLYVQAGIRLENTHIETISQRENTKAKQDFLNVFPTFYIWYKPNENNSLSMNYGKRINRPGFLLLSPFRFYINSFIYSEGNPFITPSINHNFELTHTYKGKFVTNLFMSYVTNGFDVILSGDEDTNETALITDNFFNQFTIGLSESYYAKIFPWWETSLNGYTYFVRADFNGDSNQNSIADVDQLSYYFKASNTFTLDSKKKLKAQVSFWYDSPFVRSLYEISESHSLDVSLRYSMMDNNLNLSAGMFDIFNKSANTRVSNINNIRQEQRYFGFTRYFRLSVSYSFGNKDLQNRERDFGNENERNRF